LAIAALPPARPIAARELFLKKSRREVERWWDDMGLFIGLSVVLMMLVQHKRGQGVTAFLSILFEKNRLGFKCAANALFMSIVEIRKYLLCNNHCPEDGAHHP